MRRDDIDPRDAQDAGRRLAARLVADQAQDIALSVLRQSDGEEISFDRGVVVVARRETAARLVGWLMDQSKSVAFEHVPAPDRGESDSTWTTIAMLLCVVALLALAFLAPGGA